MIEISNTRVCTLSVITPQGTQGAISRAIFKPGVTWSEIKAKTPTPRLNGAAFQHWSLTANGAAIEDNHVFSNNVYIYGVFDNTIIITAETGTEPAQFLVPVVPGTSARKVLNDLPKFKKDGFSFGFWSLDGKTAIDPQHRFQAATTIHAVWLDNTQTIEISFNTGDLFEPVASIRVAPGSQWSTVKNLVPYPEPKTDAAYFINWSTSANGAPIPDGTIFNADTNIWAKGAEATEFISINFNPHGGDPIQPLLNQPKGILYGYVRQIIDDPVRKTDADKYDEFAGWSDVEFADSELASDHAFNKSTILHAQWIMRIDVTVKNNGPDRKISNVANYWPYSDMLSKVQLQQNQIPAKHTFRCWSFTQDGPDIGTTGKLAKDTDLWAVYDKYAVINPHMFGGSGSTTVEVPINTTWATAKTKLGTPTLADNSFSHWSLTEGGAAIPDDHAFAGEVAVYANWIPYIEIEMDPRGGTPTQPAFKVPKGSKWIDIKAKVQQPTFAENTFQYWSLTANGAAISDNQVFDQPKTIIYAKWLPYVEVTFNAGVGVAIAPKKVPHGTNWATLKGQCSTTASGYRLSHWSLAANGSAIADSYTFTAATTALHAVWIKTWVVTFDAAGGSPTQSPITVDDGTTWGAIKGRVTNPSKSGYNFLGWNVV